MYEKIRQVPLGSPSLLSSVCRKQKEIRAVIAGEPENPVRKALWKVLTGRFIPGLVTIPVIPGYREELSALIPDLPVPAPDQQGVVWICAGQSCLPPVSDPEVLTGLFDRITRS